MLKDGWAAHLSLTVLWQLEAAVALLEWSVNSRGCVQMGVECHHAWSHEIQETSSFRHVLFYELTKVLIVRFQIRLQRLVPKIG